MVGPDLTGRRGRFNARDLLEAVIEPSRVVSDQYRTSRIALKDGRVLTGKIKDLSGNTLVLMADPLGPPTSSRWRGTASTRSPGPAPRRCPMACWTPSRRRRSST